MEKLTSSSNKIRGKLKFLAFLKLRVQKNIYKFLN
jgi:hypothetical protein